jgi:hypothetical protein
MNGIGGDLIEKVLIDTVLEHIVFFLGDFFGIWGGIILFKKHPSIGLDSRLSEPRENPQKILKKLSHPQAILKI